MRKAIRKATGKVEDIANAWASPSPQYAAIALYRRTRSKWPSKTPKAVRLAVAGSVGSPATIGKRFGISRNKVWTIMKAFDWSDVLVLRTNPRLPWSKIIGAMQSMHRPMMVDANGEPVAPIRTMRIRPGYLRTSAGLVIHAAEYDVRSRSDFKNMQIFPGI